MGCDDEAALIMTSQPHTVIYNFNIEMRKTVNYFLRTDYTDYTIQDYTYIIISWYSKMYQFQQFSV